MIKGQSERVILWLVPSRADTQDQASVAHLVKGRRHLRQDRRMPEGVASHQGADLHPTGRLGHRRQHRPAFPDSPRRLTRITIEEMVRKPDTIESVHLGSLRNRTDRM